MATETEWAWIAGIIEGEGCFTICNRKNAVPSFGIKVNMTDKDVIERIKTLSGFGNTYGPKASKNPKHKPHYTWSLSRCDDGLKFIDAVLPWLGIRRTKRALEVRALLIDKKARRIPQTAEQARAAQRAYYLRNKERLDNYQKLWMRAKRARIGKETQCAA